MIDRKTNHKSASPQTIKAIWNRRQLLLLPLLLATLASYSHLPALSRDPGRSASAKPIATSKQALVKSSNAPVMLGIYQTGYLGEPDVVEKELHQLDRWAGKQLSIAGLFVDIEDSNPDYNIPVPLELLRQKGYTAFINLTSSRTMAEIARGNLDRSLQRTAKAYAKWVSQGQNRTVFIAPFPEMNGSWESYREDPENYKVSFQHIQTIFVKSGVPPKAVRWVFVPNGWSSNQQRFERYYPGDDKVDVIAFSAYNWGYCSNSAAGQWKQWDTPKAVFGPYLDRMRAMAPTKPIFIAQTATTSTAKTGSSLSMKDQWLDDAYSYLAAAPGVRAILYFNINKECDWAFYNSNGSKNEGYKKAVTNPAFGYVSPAELAQMDLSQEPVNNTTQR
jgi:hypothetical protein